MINKKNIKAPEQRKSIFEVDKSAQSKSLELAKLQTIEKMKTHHWVTDGKTSTLKKN